jgi:hypothetical protein
LMKTASDFVNPCAQQRVTVALTRSCGMSLHATQYTGDTSPVMTRFMSCEIRGETC